ncbi:hypothetical protein N9142_05010, partial [Akkermansiaceae bacterium]|nr:hypothetical protein [Akkermansiaceae bacterium]
TGSQNLGGHPLDRGFDDFFGYLFHGDGHEHYPQNGTTNKTAHIYDQYQQVKNASIDLYTTDAWTAYAKKAIVEETNDGDGQPIAGLPELEKALAQVPVNGLHEIETDDIPYRIYLDQTLADTVDQQFKASGLPSLSRTYSVE